MSSKLTKNIWFRCIAVLLVISLISGGLLAILNDVLSVSSDERTSRAIKKIYGETVSFETVLDVDHGGTAIEYDKGKIEKIFKIGEDTLFRSTGYNGYKNGTITLWVKITMNNGTYKIDKVVLESYEKQTLMSKLNNGYYDNFLKDVTTTYFTIDTGSGEYSNPVSGASKSATAGVNAVNCVIEYVNGVLKK